MSENPAEMFPLVENFGGNFRAEFPFVENGHAWLFAWSVLTTFSLIYLRLWIYPIGDTNKNYCWSKK